MGNNTNENLDIIDIGDLINLASNNENVIVPYYPIYRYNNCTYSVEEQLVTIEECKKIIENNHIALYYIGIRNNIYNNDDKKIIYLRYNKLKNK